MNVSIRLIKSAVFVHCPMIWPVAYYFVMIGVQHKIKINTKTENNTLKIIVLIHELCEEKKYRLRAIFSTTGPSLMLLNIAIVSKWLIPCKDSLFIASISSPISKRFEIH